MSMNSTNANDTDIGTAYVTELFQSATSNQAMYRLARQSIKLLRQKIRTGRFDENRAPQIFQNIYLEHARAYYEQITGFKPRMKKAEKELFCKMVFEHYEEEIFGLGSISAASAKRR